jgi:hypothetical protein
MHESLCLAQQFVKSNGKYCNKCKQVGQLERECKNKTSTIYSIKFDSCSLLSKGANGVHARFISTHLNSASLIRVSPLFCFGIVIVGFNSPFYKDTQNIAYKR